MILNALPVAFVLAVAAFAMIRPDRATHLPFAVGACAVMTALQLVLLLLR